MVPHSFGSGDTGFPCFFFSRSIISSIFFCAACSRPSPRLARGNPPEFPQNLLLGIHIKQMPDNPFLSSGDEVRHQPPTKG